jgi:hypothetical protein
VKTIDEWTEKHDERCRFLVSELLVSARSFEDNGECEQCDLSVGHVCEVCNAAYVMRDAARFMRDMLLPKE